MARRELDNLAQELLVHLAEDVSREDREFVGALGVVKTPENAL